MKFFRLILSLFVLVSACGACAPQAGGEDNIDDVYKEEPEKPGPDPGDGTSWRSKLYPADWTPGDADAQGRFLHDFSYAGYHSGLRAIPVSGLNVTDVTKAPYNADPTGTADATAAIRYDADTDRLTIVETAENGEEQRTVYYRDWWDDFSEGL